MVKSDELVIHSGDDGENLYIFAELTRASATGCDDSLSNYGVLRRPELLVTYSISATTRPISWKVQGTAFS